MPFGTQYLVRFTNCNMVLVLLHSLSFKANGDRACDYAVIGFQPYTLGSDILDIQSIHFLFYKSGAALELSLFLPRNALVRSLLQVKIFDFGAVNIGFYRFSSFVTRNYKIISRYATADTYNLSESVIFLFKTFWSM